MQVLYLENAGNTGREAEKWYRGGMADSFHTGHWNLFPLENAAKYLPHIYLFMARAGRLVYLPTSFWEYWLKAAPCEMLIVLYFWPASLSSSTKVPTKTFDMTCERVFSTIYLISLQLCRSFKTFLPLPFTKSFSMISQLKKKGKETEMNKRLLVD